MADLTPEQKAAAYRYRLKLKAKSKPKQDDSTVTTEETSWFDTMRNAALNLPGSAAGVAEDLYTAVRHPLQTAQGMAELGGGTIERYTDLANQQLQKLGIPMSEEDVTLSPAGEMADKYWRDLADKIRNPAIAFSNDPAGALLDIGGLAAGGAGQIPRVARAARKLDLPEIVKASEDIKNAAYAASNQFPGKFDISDLQAGVGEAAREARFNPEVRPHLRTETGLGKFTDPQNRVFEADLPSIAEYRTTLNKDVDPEDLGAVSKARKRFDEELKKLTPEGANLLDIERAESIRHRQVQGLADILASGRLKGKVQTNEGREIGKRIVQALTNAKTKKGYSEDLVKKLTDIAEETPKSISGMDAFARMIGGGGVASAIGWRLGGLPGGVIGTAVGAMTPRIVSEMIAKGRATKMNLQLENVIRDLMNMPPEQAALALKKLTPAQRGAIFATVGVANLPDENGAGR